MRIPAPHKTGAGILNPLTTHAHNRASGFFVRTVLPRLIRVRIMAGRTGPTSVGPGSCAPCWKFSGWLQSAATP
ncbi:hypothetical protein HA154_21135 [Escherichia coli]|nr:hypothetical protein [Escherichia coli]